MESSEMKNFVTVQGVMTPVPAALVSARAGYQSSISSECNGTPVCLARVAQNATGKTTIMDPSPSSRISVFNPFQRSSVIRRTPPKTNEECLNQLSQMKEEEEKAFVDLGNKLCAINSVLTSARNIHKTIRDNVTWAVAIYQQMRECREAISKNPITETFPVTKLIVETKATQVDMQLHSISQKQQDDRSKRLLSASPKEEKETKKTKNSIFKILICYAWENQDLFRMK